MGSGEVTTRIVQEGSRCDGAWKGREIGSALSKVEFEDSEGHGSRVVQQGGNADQKLRSLWEM